MAQRPCSFTWSCRPFTSALIFGSFDRTAYGKTNSSGSTSSRQNSSTQSSFFWNPGSVEKSHAIGAAPCDRLVQGQSARSARIQDELVVGGDPAAVRHEKFEPDRRDRVVGHVHHQFPLDLRAVVVLDGRPAGEID